MGNTREYTGMKLTHGYDRSHVVGEIFLNREILDALKNGVMFDLSVEMINTMAGLEVVGVALMPKPQMPAKDEKQCSFCHTKTSNEWWRCCPEHFPKGSERSSCTACVTRNHPGFFGTGGE